MENEYIPRKIKQSVIDNTLSFFIDVYNHCENNTFYPVTNEAKLRKIDHYFVSGMVSRNIICKIANDRFIWKGEFPTEQLITDVIKESYHIVYSNRLDLRNRKEAAELIMNDNLIEEPIIELDKFGFPIEKPINEIHFEIPSSIAEETQTSIPNVAVNDDLKNLSIQVLLTLIAKPNTYDVEQLTGASIDLAKSLLRKL